MHPLQASRKRQESGRNKVDFLCNITYLIRGGGGVRPIAMNRRVFQGAFGCAYVYANGLIKRLDSSKATMVAGRSRSKTPLPRARH